MTNIHLLFLLLSFILIDNNYLHAQRNIRSTTFRIVSIDNKLPDTLTVDCLPVENITLDENVTTIITRNKNTYIWSHQSDSPMYVSIREINRLQSIQWLIEPGDNIEVHVSCNSIHFSGKGAEKLRMQNELLQLSNEVVKPSNPVIYFTKSLDDYLEWHSYLQRKWKSVEPVFEDYKDSISFNVYRYLKAAYIHSLESERHDKFRGLYTKIKQGVQDITTEIVCAVYDSTFFSSHAQWMRSQPLGLVGSVGFIKDQVLRKYNFSVRSDEYLNDYKNRNLYYEQGKKEYRGLALEKFLSYFMTKYVIEDKGFTSETLALLKKYYAEPRAPKYKAYLKEFEYKVGKLKIGQSAPEFSLLDKNGKNYKKNDFKGKLVLLKFRDADCINCLKISNALKDAYNAFSVDTNFIILDIWVGKNKNNLFKAIEKDRYYTNEVKLALDETGNDVGVLKAYGIYQFPAVILINDAGKILANYDPEASIDSLAFTNLIKSNLTVLKDKNWRANHDGPYILSEADVLKGWSIYKTNIDVIELPKNQSNTLTIHTDKFSQAFKVQLKDSLKFEPSVFDRPGKILALSDIEGNFEAFRKLLQENKVIDHNYNWIFGTGHLVLSGDIFDRGQQVTECLWLIYSLEEKAKEQGGYVHFILGNHEIMNLSGDLRYVQNKYKLNAELIKKDYVKDLYGFNSELGKWLRTKNIIEKIGNLLFVHAGISEEVNELKLSVEKINELVRPYYGSESIARTSTNKALSLLYNNRLSPFWYRNYYVDKKMKVTIKGNNLDTVYKTPGKVIDATLANYNVSHIITGHTIFKGSNFGKHVSVHFDGKVINTDTRHAAGFSEALLIEGNLFFRVNEQGKRWLLFNSNMLNTFTLHAQ